LRTEPTMGTRVTCPNPECGAVLEVPESGRARRARCRSCGTRFVLDGDGTIHPASDAGTVAPAGTPGQIGRFRIERCLGSGASGTVYLAYDSVLERDVALKVPNPGLVAGSKAAERFLREAKAAAQLHHPNIVPIFDAGQDGSCYYIASAYIPGQTLADRIGEHGLPPRKAAVIAVLLADALHYAHSMNVVHRDVKPANVIVDEDGRPHLLDFGLARLGSSDEKLTLDGAILGTPAYMAPEQADGRSQEATAASDQYSLGVTLYELLCGETPFSGPIDVVLYLAVHREPERPSKLASHAIPRELETICLKALSKNPADRYEDCAALADDLRRWLADEPIRAQPLSLAGRARRWARRHKSLAALGAAVAMLLVTVAVGSTVGFARLALERSRTMEALRRAESEMRRADAAARQAAERLQAMIAAQEQSARDQKLAQQRAEQIRQESEKARALEAEAKRNAERAEAQSKRALEQEQVAASSRLELQRQSYQTNVGNAYRALTDSVDTQAARGFLDACLPERREWAWRYCDRLLHHDLLTIPAHPGGVRSVIYGPQGRFLATAGDDGTIGLWNADSGAPIDRLTGHKGRVFALAIDPLTGDLASGGEDGRIKIWPLGSAPRTTGLDLQPGSPVLSLAYDAFGGYLVSGCADGRVILWNPRNGLSESLQKYFVFDAPAPRGPLEGTTVSQTIFLEGQQDPKLGKPVTAHKGPVLGVTFRGVKLAPGAARPENLLVVSCGEDGVVQGNLVTLSRGYEAKETTRQFKASQLAGKDPTADALLAADKDKDPVISRLGKDVTVYHVFNVSKSASIPHNEAVCCALLFSEARGEYLITACHDRTVRMFDFRQKRLMGGFAGHLRDVFGMDISPDRAWIATASGDETIRRWRVGDGVELAAYRGHAGAVRTVAISEDGLRVASGGADGLVKIWDATSRPDNRALNGHRRAVQALSFAPNSPLLGSCGEDAVVNLWDTEGNRPPVRIEDLKVPAHDLAISPDQHALALACADGALRLVTLAPRRKLAHTIKPPAPVLAVAFDPGGKYVATAGMDGQVIQWDPASGKQVGVLGHGAAAVRDLALSADGRWMATACADRTVRLWQLTPEPAGRPLEGHQDDVLRVAFDQQGTSLVSASRDGTAILWDVPSATKRLTLKGHSGDVLGVSFSPDGRNVATVGLDRTVRVWDAESGRELLVLRGHAGRPRAVAFRPDGRQIASAAEDGAIFLWDAGPR
jgi:WD40 repeat protein